MLKKITIGVPTVRPEDNKYLSFSYALVITFCLVNCSLCFCNNGGARSIYCVTRDRQDTPGVKKNMRMGERKENPKQDLYF